MKEIEIPLLRGIAEGLKGTVQGLAAQKINEAADEIERLRTLLTGWSGYAWKDGVYIDDIQAFFDGDSVEE